MQAETFSGCAIFQCVYLAHGKTIHCAGSPLRRLPHSCLNYLLKADPYAVLLCFNAVTRIRTGVAAATTQSTNHYTITASYQGPEEGRPDPCPNPWWLAMVALPSVQISVPNFSQTLVKPLRCVRMAERSKALR